MSFLHESDDWCLVGRENHRRKLSGKTRKVLLLLKCAHSVSSPLFKHAMKLT